jgi:hypothetical protein
MNTHNNLTRSCDQVASNGFAVNRKTALVPEHQLARTNRKTIYGIAMVLVSLFKFSITLIMGLTPEPMNATITFLFGCLGAALIVAGQLGERNSNR